ncbi:hypothetical protein T265_07263 [Opisthorchis viverrini]|uniref:Uncharacterized protein n=1 Tax=Opisthorchis viverrini TaxID=6198 RepID=A0A074ZD73_OPIVI|nr:hypothetical protein T265_07263 [Opisthorchis viverrini]KER25221.1 hypothetical protein T265_07263 [Opisthorchis viverrini]
MDSFIKIRGVDSVGEARQSDDKEEKWSNANQATFWMARSMRNFAMTKQTKERVKLLNTLFESRYTQSARSRLCPDTIVAENVITKQYLASSGAVEDNAYVSRFLQLCIKRDNETVPRNVVVKLWRSGG